MTSFITFIFVLSVLIFFHELGHFLFARLFKVGVKKFSLGFGPRIYGKTYGITDYRISAIPMGGYVKMVGEDPDEELDPELHPISFSHKELYKRALIVLAGPLFNLILAILIFFCFYLINGKPSLLPNIGKITENSPAQKAGLKSGDTIVEINGIPVQDWEKMASLISGSNGQEINILVKRNIESVEKYYDLIIKPKIIETKNIFGENTERYIIGITSSGKIIDLKLNFFDAFIESFAQTWKIVHLTFTSIVKIVQGSLSSDNIGGPIMIGQMAGESAKAGFSSLMLFIALISISLGVFNLLPIPVLDGGHLFFYSIEAIMRKPVSVKTRERSQQVGMLLLIAVMVYASYNDVMRFFN